MPLSGGWKNPKHKGGERFALLVISMYAETGEDCKVVDLISETGMSRHQILRIVESLKASGAVVTEGGTGRAPYIIKPASYNEAKMESQEAASDPKMSQDKMESQNGSDAKMASLYDAEPLCGDNEGRSDSILTGTPVAPSKALRTSTDIPQASLEPRAVARRHAKAESALSKLPVGDQDVLRQWRETTKYLPKESVWPFILERLRVDFDPERLKRCGGAYLAHFGMGQKHVAGICEWYRDNRTVAKGQEQPAAVKQSSTNGAKIAPLSPEQADALISKASAMLREGADISDVDRQFAPTCPRSQWATIRSAAQAQAKIRPKPSESPSARAPNVVRMNSRAQR